MIQPLDMTSNSFATRSRFLRMKKSAVAAFALIAVSGCTTTPDLTEVCLNDEGKPVSEGMTYKGKTCSKPATINLAEKPVLVWQ
ncbi:hypothetical protein [Mesorhizobium sp.]|nr:hypothetical protein [Mesorhizobium sp.]RWG87165.1 MAG: hypothetical protein EOQ70_14185 [Mesorhizobium sp.]RWK18299.1 MAG: hypothetical protein EOR41_14310 [Mesorhizobium sp.]